MPRLGQDSCTISGRQVAGRDARIPSMHADLEKLIQLNRQLAETAQARFQKGEVSQIEAQVAKVELQQGFVEQKPGPRNSKLWRLVRSWTPEEDQ